MRFLAAIFVIAILALTACNPMVGRNDGDDNRFSAFAGVEPEGWLYSSPCVFAVDTLRDSVAAGGTMLVTVRHSKDFSYANIWLELAYSEADSTLRRDTINVPLADAFGHWYGHGLGLAMEVVDTLESPYTISRGGQLSLRHIMRLDTLEGIERVGVVFIPAQ